MAGVGGQHPTHFRAVKTGGSKSGGLGCGCDASVISFQSARNFLPACMMVRQRPPPAPPLARQPPPVRVWPWRSVLRTAVFIVELNENCTTEKILINVEKAKVLHATVTTRSFLDCDSLIQPHTHTN
jgi:hypothetical protein